MRIGVAVWVCLAAMAPPLSAQTPAAAMSINPDRPDLTNSPQLVAPGIVQLEMGVIQTRQEQVHRFGSPVLARIGARQWLEAQVGIDGLLIQTDLAERVTGIGNVHVGAKIRLMGDSTGQGVFSILPQVSLPATSAAKQLGSGDPDYVVTFMTGADIGFRARLDTNYTVGAIGSGAGRGHFAQHILSASLSVRVTEQLSPYFEGVGISRQEVNGAAATTIDAGMIYTITPRLAVDAGVQAGTSGDTPAFAAFGGVSVALGHAHAGGAAPHAHARRGSSTSASAGPGRGSNPRR
jgi:hypothetical protein